MDPLQTATLDELWDELRSRCTHVVIAMVAKETDTEQGTITKFNYSGGFNACVGLAQRHLWAMQAESEKNDADPSEDG